MKAVREMNKSIFRQNLLLSIKDVLDVEMVCEEEIGIEIVPVFEKDKPLMAQDEIMRLVILSDKNIKGKILTIDQTVNLLAGSQPLVPIWIDVSFKGKVSNLIIIVLETSLRMRKPSLLRNAESGHPPFRSIKMLKPL